MTNLGRALRDAGLAASLPLAACSSGNVEAAGAADARIGASSIADAGGIIARAATPIRGVASDYDALIAASGESRFVLLGEATHGTSEFYRERARISMRLVREKGFRAIVIEGDWPDTGRVNNYVRGLGNDRSAEAAFGDFADFPRWMWRNAEFRGFVEDLRVHNMSLPAAQRVGVYGMDVYNMFGAADAVVSYLETVDRPAAAQARAQYRCFDRFRPDMASYGAAARRPGKACRAQAEAVLRGHVGRVFAARRGVYGSPRVHAELRREGRRHSRRRVARLMREMGLAARRGRRRMPRTTDSRHDLPVAPNLLGRRFAAERPDTVWLADIS